MPKDIKFNIKLAIDGKDIVLKAKADIKDMSGQLVEAKQNADSVSASFMKWSQGVMAAQMLFTLQRYEFLSKSQRVLPCDPVGL